MEEPAKDYPSEDDTEEVVLTRWEKLKKWFEILMATKKLAMLVWTIIFGVTGTMAVGQITRTNPLRDGAVELGMIEPDTIEAPVGVQSVPEHEHQHEHEMVWPEHTHPLIKHSHPEYALKDHTHPGPAAATAEAISAEIHKQLEGMIPENHMRLH